MRKLRGGCYVADLTLFEGHRLPKMARGCSLCVSNSHLDIRDSRGFASGEDTLFERIHQQLGLLLRSPRGYSCQRRTTLFLLVLRGYTATETHVTKTKRNANKLILDVPPPTELIYPTPHSYVAM